MYGEFDTRPKKQQYLGRLDGLKNERSSHDPVYRELAANIQPSRVRFERTDTNRGTKKQDSIINSTPTWASKTLASGMQAGITSPARPWFRLGTPDPDLNEFAKVKEWLALVEERIRQAFQRSNIYNALHSNYIDLGWSGTGALFIDEDLEDGLRAYVLTVGSYWLANSPRLDVDTVYRELSMTAGQVVRRFALRDDGKVDESKLSDRVINLYKSGKLDQWVDVIHVVEPNEKYQPGLIGPAGMRFSSCWFEKASASDDKMLRESGYEEFPIMATRWAVTGEDVYGFGPGHEALGDCKALQLLEERSAQVLDKIVSPPMVGPHDLINMRSTLLPGDVTYLDETQGKTFRPAITVNPQAYSAAGVEKRAFEERIKRAFSADVWLMLADDQRQKTATEVAELQKEKLLQLGPVMERVQDELLDPLIARSFAILMRNGVLPPPPEEAQGYELRVEHISVMAQAQKLIGTTAVERLTSFVGNLATVTQKMEILDKLDSDQIVDEYANMLGTPPTLVRSDEDVARIREEREKRAAAAKQQEQAAMAVQGAKTLSETDTSGDNALTRMLEGLGGGAAAQAKGLA